MGYKILLNIAYNIALFLMVMSAIWSFNHQRYGLLLGSIFVMVIVVYLKIRLIKKIKELTKSR
ncbi:DUF6358 family protein [Hufsiella ginkgonis]|uniref:Sortase n=1 Tax=Hufsiella ginkgonis TaxID=2695274 RepID=A0A7K1XT72_9SPHI|nr:DUF6358 family protein [Hufsiella ginkgonis]MXV14201.1 hypothetical protein [Hufsiella ginkgonis]